ncbi:hypothetical protein [Streptomyces sp. NPDC002132]|uniref:hypothetical protein n=1 Tax=unclassified Streptomyces TaxID=2593676 RepID=UPI00331ECC40
MNQQTYPCPALDDAHATVAELHARAAQDYAGQQAANRKKQERGGTGVRQGVLPGGGN